MNVNIGDVLEVYPNIFGKVISEYSNGYETTCGFVKTADAHVNNDVVSITYLSDYADCLPVNYFDIEWLDDRDKRLTIKEVKLGTLDAFVMEDGHHSQHVTSLEERSIANKNERN
ncbi:MAG: hypothetical protein J6Y02_04030 [Pseudobutyrivibrio sp.]|nr:hypothetical protein [Pseudobutyrivibrio sp.]